MTKETETPESVESVVEGIDYEAILEAAYASERASRGKPSGQIVTNEQSWEGHVIRATLSTTQTTAKPDAEGLAGEWRRGQRVTKTKGSNWTGAIVGFYSTELTPEGYAVESENEKGSVQIYPRKALKLLERSPTHG